MILFFPRRDEDLPDLGEEAGAGCAVRLLPGEALPRGLGPVLAALHAGAHLWGGGAGGGAAPAGPPATGQDAGKCE